MEVLLLDLFPVAGCLVVCLFVTILHNVLTGKKKAKRALKQQADSTFFVQERKNKNPLVKDLNVRQ